MDHLIKAYIAAGEISGAGRAAHWLHASGASKEWLAVHEDIIDRNFTDLAKALGYRVEKLEAEDKAEDRRAERAA